MSRATAVLRRSVRATVVLALSLSLVAGTLGPGRAVVAVSRTTAPGATGALGGEPLDGGQRAADRAIERRVRGAIRADPFLALAAPQVKVTSRRGVVRLVGRVRTAKERSSIAFKAGQSAGAGRIDDRLIIGDGIQAATW